MHRTSAAVQYYNRNLSRTDRAFVPYEKIHTFDNRIREINRTSFMEFLEGIRIGSKEQRVGAIRVTIHQEHLPERGTLDDVINVVN